jgi:hypothetical protein
VQFDLGQLEGIYDPKNKPAIYNTTCMASVKLGFGGACDNFLRLGAFDCSESNEVASSGDGYVLFSMPVLSSSSKSANLALSLVLAGVSALMWIQ